MKRGDLSMCAVHTECTDLLLINLLKGISYANDHLIDSFVLGKTCLFFYWNHCFAAECPCHPCRDVDGADYPRILNSFSDVLQHA